MANKKITDLNEATTISGTDWLVMVDVANDETKKIHANQVGGNIPIQDTAPLDPEEDDLWIDTSESAGGSNILDTIFPVGSIVIKADNEDYSSWLGFTWERTLTGRVAVGIDENDTDFDTIDNTGGSKTHTLTQNELPSSISMNVTTSSHKDSGSPDGQYLGYGTTADIKSRPYTFTNSNFGRAHDIMNPYQVVAYWKRIS